MDFIKSSKVLLFLVLIMMLTACSKPAGGNHTANQAVSVTSPEVTETVQEENEEVKEEAALTKKVQTAQGEVEIPVNPQRIVTEGYLSELLVLGIEPVGAPKWELENTVLAGMIDQVGSTDEGSPESILALNPDLIITWPKAPEVMELYEKIAPTVVIPANQFDGIYEKLRFMGDILGKESVAEQWLADFDQTVKTSRAKLAEIIDPSDTFSLMGVFVVDSGFYIYGDGEYRGGEALYKHLQLMPPEKQQAEMIGKETYRKVSYEVIGDYAGDYILLDEGDMISEVWGDNNGLWNSLDAVKNDRVLHLDAELFWGNDPISLKKQIEEIVNMIVEKNK